MLKRSVGSARALIGWQQGLISEQQHSIQSIGQQADDQVGEAEKELLAVSVERSRFAERLAATAARESLETAARAASEEILSTIRPAIGRVQIAVGRAELRDSQLE